MSTAQNFIAHRSCAGPRAASALPDALDLTYAGRLYGDKWGDPGGPNFLLQQRR